MLLRPKFRVRAATLNSQVGGLVSYAVRGGVAWLGAALSPTAWRCGAEFLWRRTGPVSMAASQVCAFVHSSQTKSLERNLANILVIFLGRQALNGGLTGNFFRDKFGKNASVVIESVWLIFSAGSLHWLWINCWLDESIIPTEVFFVEASKLQIYSSTSNPWAQLERRQFIWITSMHSQHLCASWGSGRSWQIVSESFKVWFNDLTKSRWTFKSWVNFRQFRFRWFRSTKSRSWIIKARIPGYLILMLSVWRKGKLFNLEAGILQGPKVVDVSSFNQINRQQAATFHWIWNMWSHMITGVPQLWSRSKLSSHTLVGIYFQHCNIDIPKYQVSSAASPN